MSKIKNKVFYNEPSGVDVAKAQEENQTPYKGVYSNEVYTRRIETAAEILSTASADDTVDFVDSNLASRVDLTIDCLSAGVLDDPPETASFINTVLAKADPTAVPHTLTFSAVNGTVDKTTFTGKAGETVEVTVSPNTGYAFDKWSDSVNPRTFTIGSKDESFSAECQSTAGTQVHINAACFNGSIVATVAGVVVSLPYECDPGTTVNLAVTATTGYTWKSWSDGVTTASRDVVVNADTHLAGYCDEDVVQYDVIFNSVTDEYDIYGYTGTWPAGADIPDGLFMSPQKFVKGMTFHVMCIPDSSREFTAWSDGVTDNPREVTVTGDLTFGCTTAVKKFTFDMALDSSSYASWIVSVDGTQVSSFPTQVPYESEIIVKAQPDSSHNQEFQKFVDQDGYEITENPYTFNIYDDTTLTCYTQDYSVPQAISFIYDDGSATNTIACQSIFNAVISDDGSNWSYWDGGTHTLPSGNTVVYVAAKAGSEHLCGFSGNFSSVEGDCRNLINYTDPSSAECHESQFYSETSSTGLFTNCTSLRIVNEDFLSFYTLNKSCYKNMFKGCTALEQYPNLEKYAQTLAESCCESMYEGCTGIYKLYGIPMYVETVPKAAFKNMFKSATNAEGTAYIPASTVEESGCEGMFNGANIWDCQLYPETVAASAYKDMFNDCPNLSSAEVWIKTMANSTSVENMFGTANIKFSGHSIAGWDTSSTGPLASAAGIEFDDCITLYKDSADLKFKIAHGPANTNDTKVQYLTIGSTAWTDYTINTEITTASHYVWLRGKIGSNTLSGISGDFIEASGDLVYLIDYANPDAIVLHENQFFTADSTLPLEGEGLFTGVSTLVDNGIQLSWTSLETNCYRRMFANTSITDCCDISNVRALADGCFAFMYEGSDVWGAYDFPNAAPHSTTGTCTGCYRGMFKNCTKLTTAPILPATDLSTGPDCYKYMFAGCTNLTWVDENMLPATVLSAGCYYEMFSGSGIQNLPLLPCTDMSSLDCYWSSLDEDGWIGCYSAMFKNCTGLTTLPVTSGPYLPATVLSPACYGEMFKGCTNLVSIPDLSHVTTLAFCCYKQMFMGCYSLTDLSGVDICTSTAALVGNIHDSEHTETTHLRGCFQEMFSGCYHYDSGTMTAVGITKAPKLYAETLTNWCYYKMFYGDACLNEIYCYATDNDHDTTLATYAWVNGVYDSTGAYAGDFHGKAVMNPYSGGTATHLWSTGEHGVPGISSTEHWTYTNL